MIVKFIPPAEVLPLRSLVLRDGMPQHLCVFDEDEWAETFHLGVIDTRDEQPKSILTAFPKKWQSLTGRGYQLRGMATHPDFQGMGLGAKLVRFLSTYLKEQGADYIWCNARVIAFPFYQKMGFQFLSDAFEIPEVGVHRAMYLLL